MWPLCCLWGVSLGLDLSRIALLPGPDVVGTLKGVNETDLPVDIRPECFGKVDEDRIQTGDWLAIWGGTCFLYESGCWG